MEEDEILNLLYQTQTDLIVNYAEARKFAVDIGGEEDMIQQYDREHDMLLEEINKRIERRRQSIRTQ